MTRTPEVGSVVVLTSEDDTADTLVPRLEAAGADRDKIVQLNYAYDAKSIAAKTKEILKDWDDIRLMILDPLTEYIGNTDSHRNTEVRVALRPLIEFASERNINF